MENAEQTGAAYLAGTLRAYGVRALFLVPTIISDTLYALEPTPEIARVVTHGEKAAAYMADGYARATGTPGVCFAQQVGSMNLAAGLQDPFLGCSPVVAITGGPFSRSYGRQYYQEVNHSKAFDCVTKFNVAVTDAERLPDLLEQAFRVATSDRPGPTHLQLSGHAGEVSERGAVTEKIPGEQIWSVPYARSEPSDLATAQACQALAEADRPIMVVGGGARSSGAAEEVLQLAELLQMPIVASLNAKDVVPTSHALYAGVAGLYSRGCANEAVLEADLVMFIGSQAGSQVTLNWQVPRADAEIIQLDVDASALGRHYRNTIGLLGDAKLGLQKIIRELSRRSLNGQKDRSVWQQRVNELRKRWTAENLNRSLSDEVPLRPERLCSELSRCLPGDALVVADTGHAGMWTGGYLDLKAGQQYIRAAGSLGWALPAGIGAQFGAPSRRVIVFTGDGGLWYHLSELETAVRWKLPVVIIVNNNRSLNQEIRPYTIAYGGALHGRHAELWQFEDVNLARVAEAIGAIGLTIRKASEFEVVMEQALATEGPVLVDVCTAIDALAPLGVAEFASV